MCTMGSTKLWLPSRKSVESHRGGLSIVLLGHCRFSSLGGENLLYLREGSLSLAFKSLATVFQDPKAQELTYIGMMTDGGVTVLTYRGMAEQLLLKTRLSWSKYVL